MKNCVAFAILVLCVASAHGIVWKDCGSKLSKVKDVLVSGCEKVKICPLPRGENVTFKVDFITNAGADGAKSVVHGIIDKIPLPFPFDKPNACTDKQCGLICPLKTSTSYSYHPDIFIQPQFPKVKVIVKWELQDDNKQDIFCIEVPAEIVDSKNPENKIPYGLAFSNKMPKFVNPTPDRLRYTTLKNTQQVADGMKFSNKMLKGSKPIPEGLRFSHKMPKSIKPILESLRFSNKMPKSIKQVSEGLRFNNKLPIVNEALKFSNKMPKYNQKMQKLNRIF